VSARIQYRVWQSVTAVVGRLPPRVAYALAVALGWAAWYCWPRGRRSMLGNYRRVLPGASLPELRRVARRSLVNYLRYLADFMRLPRLSPGEAQAAVEGDGPFEALRQTLECGRGAVIVCMHFGNWDLGAAAAAARGFPLTVVAESFADKRLDAMVVGSRARMGMQVIKMERAGPSLIKALRRNGLLALLIDRPTPGDGVKVRFFGEEVEVPAGPARLALRTGAKVVPTAFVRLDGRRPDVRTLADFSIDYQPTGDDALDVRELTQRIMSVHESYIRRYPDQWYMFREMWPRSAGPRPLVAA
jgi:phosphatidylinositol dimannoside acyltransferase